MSLFLPNSSQRVRFLREHALQDRRFRSTLSRLLILLLLVLLPLPLPYLPWCRISTLKGRGRTAGAFTRLTHDCTKLHDGFLPVVLDYLLPRQGFLDARRSGVESRSGTTDGARPLSLGSAHLPGVGAGDELQDGGFDALVSPVSASWYITQCDVSENFAAYILAVVDDSLQSK